jgi:trimeric autotransporter adhesin
MLKKIFFTALLFIAAFAHAQNVGIGTTTPQSQLHIGDNSMNELIIGRNKTSGGFTALYMGTSAVSNGYSYVQSVRSAGSQYGNLILNPFNGNVGIATNNPLFKLDVRGGSINAEGAYYIGGAPILVSPGNFNLFTGLGAGGAVTTGTANTAYGSFALYSNTIGNNNTAIGSSALFSNNSINGEDNTAVGAGALYSSPSSRGNTAIGKDALHDAVNIGALNSWFNTAVGFECMKLNTSGFLNTAVGSYSLSDNLTGYRNTVLGYRAGVSNTDGYQNVFMGYSSGSANTSGDSNICLGSGANVGTGNLTNATAIGASTMVNASNKIRLGNSSVTAIEGNVAYTFPSDGRFKTNITETVKGLDFIMKLRPVVYNFQAKKMDEFLSGKPLTDERFDSLNYTIAENMRQSGFIAQEVEQAAMTAGYDFNGVLVPKNEKETYSLAYSQFVVPLVKAVQEQQQLIIKLQKEIEELKRKMTAQK